MNLFPVSVISRAIPVFTGIALFSSASFAWDQHRELMPWIAQGLSPATQNALNKGVPAPCSGDDRKTYLRIAEALKLQTQIETPPTRAEACTRKESITLKSVLLDFAADEPDMGMDKELPESADPKGERKFMGGTTGPTSQGFRHMFFGGWKLSNPLTTFQVPTQAIGQAPERVELIAEKAKELLKSGELAWGTRVLGWSTHYLQDLAQPFHSTQIPHLMMVPWSALLQWPPSNAFGSLVKETTRTISNYHYAYEWYTRFQVNSATGETGSQIRDCMAHAEKHSSLQFDPVKESPLDLAMKVAERSIAIAPEVGAGCIDFFGSMLKDPEYDLPHGKGKLDFEALSRDPARKKGKDRLDKISCEALANGVMASRMIIEWALKN